MSLSVHGVPSFRSIPYRERYDRSVEYMRSMLEVSELDRETKQSSLARLAELQ